MTWAPSATNGSSNLSKALSKGTLMWFVSYWTFNMNALKRHRKKLAHNKIDISNSVKTLISTLQVCFSAPNRRAPKLSKGWKHTSEREILVLREAILYSRMPKKKRGGSQRGIMSTIASCWTGSRAWTPCVLGSGGVALVSGFGCQHKGKFAGGHCGKMLVDLSA